MATQRLISWNRLWIFITVLYGIIVGFIAYTDAPSRDEIINMWAYQLIAACQDYIHTRSSPVYLPDETLRILIESGESIDQHKRMDHEEIVWVMTEDARNLEPANPKQKEHYENYKQEVLNLETMHKAELKQLPRDLFNHYLTYLKYWLIPSLVLLLFGHAVARVIRGFPHQ